MQIAQGGTNCLNLAPSNTPSISCSGAGHRPSETPTTLSSLARLEKPIMPAVCLHAVLDVGLRISVANQRQVVELCHGYSGSRVIGIHCLPEEFRQHRFLFFHFDEEQ